MRIFPTVLIIVVVLAANGCGISETVHRQKMGELNDRISVLGEDNTRLQEELTKLPVCQRELAALKNRGAKLDAGLSKALDRIQELEKIAAQQRAVFDQLRGALDSLVQAGKLSIAIVRGQFTVQMADKILFDSGKSDVKAEAQATLTELTSILASVPSRRYQISGHTDSRGSDKLNWRLSGARARSVLKYMLEQGMPPTRVSYAGYGPYQPTADNDSPESMALNRRIEIVLVPDMESFLSPFRTP